MQNKIIVLIIIDLKASKTIFKLYPTTYEYGFGQKGISVESFKTENYENHRFHLTNTIPTPQT